jgi:D-alanine-D-alanine ligase-like ATP-grasp enzyme
VIDNEPGFAARLKTAVRGDPAAPLVFLGNFEVENAWGKGEVGLPSVGFSSSNVIVNRMDEFAVLLATPDDYVLLKAAPDPDYLAWLAAAGFGLPRLLVAANGEPERTVTQDVLHDPVLVDTLAGLADTGAALLPHGVSDDEEHLAAACGLPLATPPAALCKAVNSKIYSRQLATRLDLRQPPGRACPDAESWSEAMAWARRRLAAGARIGVKDAYGVSGKGIVLVEDEGRLGQLDRMVMARLRRAGTSRMTLVVEEWVPKATDLNYQFTVARDGGVRLDFVKEAVTERGVHKGHRMPVKLTGGQQACLKHSAQRLGEALAADGYYGVVGVDAMIDPSGGIYPVIEINARNNMSTYQVRVQEEVAGPDQTVLARHYPVRRTGPLPFRELASRLGGLLMDRPGGSGLLVNNFATVSAGAISGEVTEGRLYGMVIADDADAVDRLDAEVSGRLARSWAEGTVR